MSINDRHAQNPCGGCNHCPGGNGGGPATRITRRNFMKGVVGFFAVAWGVMASVPFIRFLASSAGDEAGEQVASVSLGPVDSLASGQGKNFKFGSIPALIVRNDAGDFHAYNAVCTHLGCTVQYAPEREAIWCACHGGVYDPETGRNIAGPPPRPLQGLDVAVVDDEIIVTRPGVRSEPPEPADTAGQGETESTEGQPS